MINNKLKTKTVSLVHTKNKKSHFFLTPPVTFQEVLRLLRCRVFIKTLKSC